MSLPKVSPSRLDRLAACPRYVMEDRTDNDRADAMDAGTRFHSLMEEIAKSGNPVLRISQVPDYLDRRSAEYAWGQVAGIIAAGAAIEGTEVAVKESSVCRRGFIDLLLSYGGGVVVVDWKLTRAVGEHDLQMAEYASAMMEQNKVSFVRALVIAPMIQHVDDVTYSSEDLARLIGRVTDLMEKVENPFVPARPGDVCNGCKWAGRCPAQCRELVPVSNSAQMPVAFNELLSPATPEGRARRRYFIDWIASAVDGIKEDDLAWVKAGNAPPPGYKLIQKAGVSSIPPESVGPAIDKLVQSGFSLDSIHAACKLYTSKMAKNLAPVMGESDRDLKKKLDGLISEFMINGGPSEYLQRTSKKAMAELFKATLEPKQVENK